MQPLAIRRLWYNDFRMNDEFDVLFEVTDRLEAAGIAYMVTGSIASAVYAVPRMTRDIDIVVQIGPADADAVIAAFKEDYYLDEESIHEAIRRRGMFNIINQRTIIKVDFIVRKGEEYRIEEFTRRRQATFKGKAFWIAAPEDLILSKLLWVKESESELQFRDVKQLIHTVKELDGDYLRSRATQLGVADLLAKAVGHES